MELIEIYITTFQGGDQIDEVVVKFKHFTEEAFEAFNDELSHLIEKYEALDKQRYAERDTE